ncbi:hypothetical protein FHG64_06430 [Antarcticibacterium flavum]|uniref:Endonuclease GajA/Old nuclease/RecF-like AAA domain-containing protein n=1 Tax=Antarcticibacterium flavum TaxID=2058175 RepID=A0A5B7X320_9FLAO|nr:AAA family ATPase [Antarcticibacterium flavum]QCY69071.1 hypothetical protein FHG64_06430 [Antarcticibacterium flavum]
MKIELRNFGPIDRLQFDLNKDLHLIFGQNAIGKSYATYGIYCLIKNIKNKSFRNRYFYYRDLDTNDFHKFIKNTLKNRKKQQRIDLSLKYKTLIENELRLIILSGLQNSLRNTFSSLHNLKNRFTNKNFEFIIYLSDSEKIRIFADDEGTLDLEYLSKKNKLEFILKDTKTTKFSLYSDDKKQFGKGKEDDFLIEFVRFSIGNVENILKRLDHDIRDIYYLPASRSGLYQALSAFTPMIAELTQNRFFMQNKSIELPSLSEPLSDYFIDLSTVDKKNSNKEFTEVINFLEKEILKGAVKYDEKTKRILYLPQNVNLELNLSEASSMVAELSPLVLYFKHILNYKYSSLNPQDRFFFDGYYQRRSAPRGYDILFVEEPEAHLHPEIQVKLIDLFVQLTNQKLKIFITSHSNYMFNKLNNLLIKKDIKENKVKVYHLVHTKEGPGIRKICR